jgi:hypothetical protein
MRFQYEPYVMRRFDEGRIFFVSAQMPFEFYFHCFQAEQPFCLISQLEDGRIAIVPNAMFLPWNVLQGGRGPLDLLPSEFEYVTMKDGLYPLIITAHPVTNVDEWLRTFERRFTPFLKQTLWQFVSSAYELMPLKPYKKFEKFEKYERVEGQRFPVAESANV